MGTEILKSFGNLQSELEQAKSSLKGVDENIKRLIGRDPSELPPRNVAGKRPGAAIVAENKNARRPNRSRGNFLHENDEPSPPAKRRNSGISVFKRLDRPAQHYEEMGAPKQMISKVIVTPKEVPSRQEALEAQSKDERSKERNRRMFGALLGTLQKFQQEETKLKHKEEKRAQLEKKIEEHEIKEKQEIKKERQELFLNRRRKQAEIKMIEMKMLRMKNHAAWEERQKPRMHSILTKSKPRIHYLPRKLNDTTKELLESTKKEIEELIENRRKQVSEELKNIEERMKRNFEGKSNKEKESEDVENHFEEEMMNIQQQENEELKEENKIQAENAVSSEASTEMVPTADDNQINGTNVMETSVINANSEELALV